MQNTILSVALRVFGLLVIICGIILGSVGAYEANEIGSLFGGSSTWAVVSAFFIPFIAGTGVGLFFFWLAAALDNQHNLINCQEELLETIIQQERDISDN